MNNSISNIQKNIASFVPGENVETSFGPGVVSSVNLIDSLIYVALSRKPKALYIFKPEQLNEATAGV
ncbi:MAG: hypothetical protein AB1757_08695 [Acidobacteriota bacterium]